MVYLPRDLADLRLLLHRIPLFETGSVRLPYTRRGHGLGSLVHRLFADHTDLAHLGLLDALGGPCLVHAILSERRVDDVLVYGTNAFTEFLTMVSSIMVVDNSLVFGEVGTLVEDLESGVTLLR